MCPHCGDRAAYLLAATLTLCFSIALVLKYKGYN